MNQYFVLTRSKRHQQVISQDSSKYIFRYLDQGASGYKSNPLTLSKRSMESLKMGCILRQLVSYLARQTLFEVPQSSDWWFVQGLNWWSLSSRGGKSFTCMTKMVFRWKTGTGLWTGLGLKLTTEEFNELHAAIKRSEWMLTSQPLLRQTSTLWKLNSFILKLQRSLLNFDLQTSNILQQREPKIAGPSVTNIAGKIQHNFRSCHFREKS